MASSINSPVTLHMAIWDRCQVSTVIRGPSKQSKADRLSISALALLCNASIAVLLHWRNTFDVPMSLFVTACINRVMQLLSLFKLKTMHFSIITYFHSQSSTHRKQTAKKAHWDCYILQSENSTLICPGVKLLHSFTLQSSINVNSQSVHNQHSPS